ncbi:Aromatic acid exporter family member 1 [Nakamurella panacisegetis]|uniref:Aromatic acid exporter family member 1 n=1 Tax=Nakamurella panacisegetis TaxID=1090615 RepID=A0A1H0QR54_9ACTN|nr:Aromatic acid exporter family member 1 [Nakamurella panacisegetis]
MPHERLRRAQSRWHRLAWRVWPSFPTSWSDIPARVRPGAAQIGRLTAAAVIAYLVATAVSPGILDLTAPLTALLVVQASTVGTLRMGLVRVGAVLTGVLVAVGMATWFGLSWWSLAAVISASLVLAKVLRLGEQSLEAPISAMLILAVSSPEVAAEVRVVNTLIGTAVGIAFSLLLPVSIPSERASDALRVVARSQAALLEEIALTLGDGPPHPDEVRAWSDWTADIARDVNDASAAVHAVQESLRLNPRALITNQAYPGLPSALDRLDRCLAAERALVVVVGQASPMDRDGAAEPFGAELPGAFAVVFDDLANGLRAYGDLISAQYGTDKADRVEEAMSRTRSAVEETRAVLSELMTLQVDPTGRPELWMLQGSVLTAVDQLLHQLEHSTDPTG